MADEKARDVPSREPRKTPRLSQLFPSLTSLRIDATEENLMSSIRVRKEFLVARARASFEIRCGDESCEGGGYDITAMVLRALEAREERHQGSQACRGAAASVPCRRKIRFELFAAYQAPN